MLFDLYKDITIEQLLLLKPLLSEMVNRESNKIKKHFENKSLDQLLLEKYPRIVKDINMEKEK